MALEQAIVLGITLVCMVIAFGSLWGLSVKWNEAKALKEKCDRLIQDKGNLKQQVNALATQEQSLGTLLAKTQKDLSALKEATELQDKQDAWCNTALLSLPTDTPQKLHNRTLVFKKHLLSRPENPSLYDLRQQKNFATAASWELYWCLAHAAQAALGHCKVYVEDSITDQFVRALEKNVARLPSVTANGRPLLKMAYCAIYGSVAPNLKEADVGADLLLAVGGNGLVSNGGGRLLWIQAKKANETRNAYMLDCSYANSNGLQLGALKKVDRPKKGSMAFYIQYSSKLTFIPALALTHYSPAPGEKSVDLSEHGVRFQELATALLSLPYKEVGTFTTPTDAIKFIDSVGNNKPLYVVSVTADDSGRWIAQDFVNKLEDYYSGELNLSHSQEHSHGRRIERDHDFDRDM